jgi:pyruvate dehydrogenase E2 component (dihydrolipoamide acetyltransferase)
MSVSVSMPQLGESVTEGTVTRWLKREGERVEADEPLLEVSTDKVDTEIPSPVSGILRGISVAEDETVAVGAELAVIDEEGAGGGAAGQAAAAAAEPPAEPAEPAAEDQDGQAYPDGEVNGAQAYAEAYREPYQPPGRPAGYAQPYQEPEPELEAEPEQAEPEHPYQEPEPAGYQQPYQEPAPQPATGYQQPEPAGQPDAAEQPEAADEAGQPDAAGQPEAADEAGQPDAAEQPEAADEAEQPEAADEAEPPEEPEPPAQPASPLRAAAAAAEPAAGPEAGYPPTPHAEPDPAERPADRPAAAARRDVAAAAVPAETPADLAEAVPQLPSAGEGPYVTPLVRKLAAEHGVDLAQVPGTGVGGRIRKQDVLDAARTLRVPGTAAAAAQAPSATAPKPVSPAAEPQLEPLPPTPARAARAIVPSSLRGKTEKMSRSRQVIAQRMVESLQTSAQLTTVVEADVTAIARLRDLAKPDFEAREGVKLSFLPFFALATVEALKVHPKLNAVIDSANAQVTYQDAEHLGIAVDTERGLMVPVIRKAGDLNIGGLARKIADLAERTRAGQVSPDELSGGTFTLTNTGSRGALFDTPIINQPQVGILGTGTVVKRAVVVDDPALGEVITVRSMVYLALTYDHRLVDGADAVRFLLTIKSRLEEGAFEAELGL